MDTRGPTKVGRDHERRAEDTAVGRKPCACTCGPLTRKHARLRGGRVAGRVRTIDFRLASSSAHRRSAARLRLSAMALSS